MANAVFQNEAVASFKNPSYQAYQILRLEFTVAFIIVGLDKFFNFFTNWEQYLAPSFDFFGNPSTTMMVVGIIEILIGIGVWFKPKIFAYIRAMVTRHYYEFIISAIVL